METQAVYLRDLQEVTGRVDTLQARLDDIKPADDTQTLESQLTELQVSLMLSLLKL